MRIVNTHYVQLNAPYPIIYCKGEVGMQIGTLIVVEDNYKDDPQVIQNRATGNLRFRYPYGITSHSHPVVTYGNKYRVRPSDTAQPNDWSEAVVWDKFELRDVITLCFSDEDTIDISRLHMLVSGERLSEMLLGKSDFSINSLVQQLKRLGITSIFRDVDFREGGSGCLYLLKGGLREGTSSITSNNISGLPYLFIATEYSDEEKTFNSIQEQVDDYLRAIAPRKVKIEFKYKDEEIRSLTDHLNSIYNKDVG